MYRFSSDNNQPSSLLSCKHLTVYLNHKNTCKLSTYKRVGYPRLANVEGKLLWGLGNFISSLSRNFSEVKK